MSSVVVAHVAADAEHAQDVCASLQHAAALSVVLKEGARPLAFGADMVLALIWSSKAAACEALLLDLLAVAPNAVFLVRADDAPLSAQLAALKLHMTPERASPEEIATAFKVARLTAGRSRRSISSAQPPAAASPALAAARVEPAQLVAAGYKKVFLGGMTQGLASSVAVLSLGGVITIGIQERAGVIGMTPSDAQAVGNASDFALVEIAGATDDVDEALYEPFGPATQPGILAGDALVAEATELRATAQMHSAAVDARLNAASDTLSVVRLQTTHAVDRLEQIAAAPTQELAPIMPVSEPQAAPASPSNARAPASVVRAGAPSIEAHTPATLQPASLVVAGADESSLKTHFEHAKDDEAAQLWSPTS